MNRIHDLRFLPARIAIALTAALVAWPCAAHPPKHSAQEPVTASAPQTTAAPHGLANFGEVTPTLFRGGQPSKQGYAELKKLGVATVVTFRGDHGLNAHEKAAVEAQGMHFVAIPWSAFGKPSDAQVAEFFQLLRSHPDQRVYVHCVRGGDRTGVMIAAYRMAVENWTPEKALKEMYEYHFWHVMFPHLTAYVKDFPRLLGENQGIRAALPAPQTAGLQ